ncbi:TetR family transcriptional regulator [Nocardioides sp. zg-579]|uniref:TetR family transcriptional regulator n=1 Tax=Nocardioides marmotae TaxID=2663857 RepID=A0A6I3JC52_9ACTN|nr:TetR/AcrR family transcriptional regulator [Nocardioides marmotae]MCR6032060.1 TetR family transcriptional regulator [Gordonia jinghuaiqii]MTB95704.1 TetR family transcriptional regulator [Nocardioides marmotae]QKE01108.1 TetR/AcrR family transcriptional regulator [Nocardioides marmotae]
MSRSSSGYHHGDLRRALLDAGTELLEEQAPARVSLREVARRAGVSHAAPYHHFGDRGGLLKAIGDACMADFLARQEGAAAAESDPAERLVAVGEAYVSFAAERPHAFALVFDPELCPPQDPGPERGPLIARNEALLAECVAAWLADRGRAAEDLEALGTAFWGTVHGLATLVGERQLERAQVGPALRALVR